MKHYIIITLLIFFVCSCSNSGQFYSVNTLNEITNLDAKDSLDGIKVFSSHAQVIDIYATDKYYVLVQNYNDTIFLVLDLKTDKVVASFGQVGHAKNEFLQPPLSTYVVRGDDGKYYLGVYEWNNTKWIDIDASVIEQKRVINRIFTENSRDEFIHHRKIRMPDKKEFIYKTVSYRDCREKTREKPSFSYLDNDSVIKEWDIFPEIIKWDEPYIYESEYMGHMRIKQDNSKAAFIMHKMDVITIFDLENYSTIGIHNIDNKSFDYYDRNISTDNFYDRLVMYNRASCASNDRLFVLKDYRLYLEMCNSESETYPSTIEIYDWNGRFISKVGLKQTMSRIAYDESTNTLIGVSHMGMNIYKYKLKSK